MKLDLKKIWEILNKISWEKEQLSEKDIWVNFLGHRSEYFNRSFESFLEYYSFRINEEDGFLVIYNSDGIAYEDFNNDDFSYLPLKLLNFGEEELKQWVQEETEKHLEQREKEKQYEQERIKEQIKQLEKRLL